MRDHGDGYGCSLVLLNTSSALPGLDAALRHTRHTQAATATSLGASRLSARAMLNLLSRLCCVSGGGGGAFSGVAKSTRLVTCLGAGVVRCRWRGAFAGVTKAEAVGVVIVMPVLSMIFLTPGVGVGVGIATWLGNGGGDAVLLACVDGPAAMSPATGLGFCAFANLQTGRVGSFVFVMGD